MEKEFNQKEYIKEYQKENYKQFKTKLKPDEMKEINKFLKEKNINKRELVLKGKELLEREMGNMKKVSYEKLCEEFAKMASKEFGIEYNRDVNAWSDDISKAENNGDSKYENNVETVECELEVTNAGNNPLLIDFKIVNIFNENDELISTEYYI